MIKGEIEGNEIPKQGTYTPSTPPAPLSPLSKHGSETDYSSTPTTLTKPRVQIILYKVNSSYLSLQKNENETKCGPSSTSSSASFFFLHNCYNSYDTLFTSPEEIEGGEGSGGSVAKRKKKSPPIRGYSTVATVFTIGGFFPPPVRIRRTSTYIYGSAGTGEGPRGPELIPRADWRSS